MIGRRTALLKNCVACFATVTNMSQPLVMAQKGLDDLSTGIQLVDDLVDWNDDFDSKIFTYPLVLCFQHLHKQNPALLTPNEIEKIIVENGVADQVLYTAERYLFAGKRELESIGAQGMVTLTSQLLRSVNEMRAFLRTPGKLKGSLSVALKGRLDINLMH